jgi:hypothetical protein
MAAGPGERPDAAGRLVAGRYRLISLIGRGGGTSCSTAR